MGEEAENRDGVGDATHAEPDRTGEALLTEELCLAFYQSETEDELIEHIEAKACQILHCEYATVFGLREEQGVTSLAPLKRKKALPSSFRVAQGLAGRVARTREPVLTNQPEANDHFIEAVDGLAGVPTRSIGSAPMLVGEQLLGVLQLVNRVDRPFEMKDLRWLRRLSQHGALALAQVRKAQAGSDLVMRLARTVAAMVDERYGTVGHVERVRRMALVLGQGMKLSQKELQQLELAANLHDIGRLGLSPMLLRALKNEDPDTARQLEYALNRSLFQRLEMEGPYAGGASGASSAGCDRISRVNKILKVVDAFDLLTIGSRLEDEGTDLEVEEALKVIIDRSSHDLDPIVVETLVQQKVYELERRESPRFASQAPITVRVLEQGEAGRYEDLEIKGLDLSKSGAQFWSNKQLPLDALLELRIILPSGAIAGFVRIARQVPDAQGYGYRVGVYFLGYRSQ